MKTLLLQPACTSQNTAAWILWEPKGRASVCFRIILRFLLFFFKNPFLIY